VRFVLFVIDAQRKGLDLYSGFLGIDLSCAVGGCAVDAHGAGARHGVGGLAVDNSDRAAAVRAFVPGTNDKPRFMAFADRADVPGITERDGFAGAADHRSRIAGLYRRGFCTGSHVLRPVPVLWTGAGMDRGGTETEGESQERT
jgi:hypothetical protein